MLVRIISGTYGHRTILPDGVHRLTPVKAGETCEVEKAEGLRLIGLGVAIEAVPDVEHTAEIQTQEEPKNGNPEPVSFSTDMSIASLRAAMRERGLQYNVRMTKEQLVAAIEAAEDAPVLEPEDVVE